MARRQDHKLEVLGVPSTKNHAAVVRVRAELVHDLGELVDALARVVCVAVGVFGAKVAPLEAVDGAQVAHLAVLQSQPVQELTAAVAVPDLDPGVAQGLRRRRARHEPQQLEDHGPREDALRRQQREDWRAVLVEGELEGARCEDGVCARAGPVCDVL